MTRPVHRTNRVFAANRKNKIKHCLMVLPGENLTDRMSADDVTVKLKPQMTDVFVQSARAVRDRNGNWVLVVKTDRVSDLKKSARPRRRGEPYDGDEVSVTVTDPETQQPSDPVDVEVVYYNEEYPKKRKRSKKAAKKKRAR